VSAPLSIRDFARVVLPRSSQDGILGMLTAYFDDSGTHLTSDVVLLVGVFGNEHQWTFFENLWRKRLNEAVPGKDPIHRFHHYDCHQSINEFLGWSRTETDFFVHELGQILSKTMLWGCAAAISRKDWDRAVTGDLKRATGDPEGGCVRGCFYLALEWGRLIGGKELALVFEDRPERNKEYAAIYNAYSHYRRIAKEKPELVSLTFADASKILPLQAADLIAWELYQDELHFLNDPARRKKFKSPLIKRLAESGRFKMMSADSTTIGAMVASVDAPNLFEQSPQLKTDIERFFEGKS
jgi:hypothetical protein